MLRDTASASLLVSI
jgi:hypothetical protein